MWRTFVRLLMLALLGLSLLPSSAVSKEKSSRELHRGTLKNVSMGTTRPDGRIRQICGPHPNGKTGPPPALSFYPPDDL